jgi:hypothetical protein
MAIPPLPAPGERIPQLCRSLVEDPQEIANSHVFKGTLYRIASVISAIAMVAIFTGSMALYLGLIASPPTWIVAISLISALACMQGLGLWHVGTDRFAKAHDYQLIADQLNKDEAEGGIRDWDPPKIAAFFQEQELPGLLAPDTRLLPLIARYRVLTEQAKKVRGDFEENIRLANPQEEELEMMHRFTAMNKAENLAFIQLKRAVILENLRFPEEEYEFSTNALTVNGQPQGSLLRKDVQMRAVDYIADRAHVFFVNLQQQEMTLEDFRGSEPKDLRRRIFDYLPVLG